MSAMLLNKEKWPDFVAGLGEKKLLAPQADSSGDYVYAPCSAGEIPPLMEGGNTRVPPKQILFPQTETLYCFQLGREELEEPLLEEETVVLGVRPCDARAMSIVEKLFRWDIDDPYYLKRRELVTLVGFACGEPGLNCFCTSVGGGPASTEGLDLLMTDLGENYLMEAFTPKGENLLSITGAVLDTAGKADLQKKEACSAAAENKIKRTVDTDGLAAGLPTLWDSPMWNEISSACLGCGICTYLCPTCHCFDIQDEVEGFAARRCRMWDSCMFEEYTLHTSGHNPRPSRRERTRNRINHKFSYYVDKFAVTACVGCGRCVNLCPVNIDIIEILRQVKEAL